MSPCKLNISFAINEPRWGSAQRLCDEWFSSALCCYINGAKTFYCSATLLIAVSDYGILLLVTMLDNKAFWEYCVNLVHCMKNLYFHYILNCSRFWVWVIFPITKQSRMPHRSTVSVGSSAFVVGPDFNFSTYLDNFSEETQNWCIYSVCSRCDYCLLSNSVFPDVTDVYRLSKMMKCLPRLEPTLHPILSECCTTPSSLAWHTWSPAKTKRTSSLTPASHTENLINNL